MNPKIRLLLTALSVAASLPSVAYAQSTTALLYKKTVLVSDTKGSGLTQDPVLVNPWGMAFQPDGAFWINDSNSGVATLYDGNGPRCKRPSLSRTPSMRA